MILELQWTRGIINSERGYIKKYIYNFLYLLPVFPSGEGKVYVLLLILVDSRDWWPYKLMLNI